MDQKTVICACAACYNDLFEGDDLVQHPVYKCGELNYIELAHRSCLPEWAQFDNWKPTAEELDEDFDLTQEEIDAFCAQAGAERAEADEEDFRLGFAITARLLRTKIDSRFETERDHGSLGNGFFRRRARRAKRHAGKAQARELLSAYG